MKRFRLALLVPLLALPLFTAQKGWCDDYPYPSGTTVVQQTELFSDEELDDLVAPIALYPDPLLAQIFPAATFIDQIDAAARYVGAYGATAGIDQQPWDVSVRAVAHYSDVLFMMDRQYDWTVSLGQAFINQPDDLFEAVQRLRREALALGSLVSTPQQTVIDEDGFISIVPAQPQVIYVPSYDPMVVYTEPPPPYGFISFSVGFTIGAWLNRDFDWHHRRVFYHGWRGGGWIGRSRPFVHPKGSVYIRPSYSEINVNRRVMQHDVSRFRQDIRRNAEIRRERRPPGGAERNRPSRGGPEKRGNVAPPATRTAPEPRRDSEAPQPRSRIGAPGAVPASPPAQRPADASVYRGRQPRTEQPSTGAYGGYGSGSEAQSFRERGQSSRRSQPAPQVSAPARKGSPARAPSAPPRQGGNVRQQRPQQR